MNATMGLTGREKEILRLVLQGKINKEIASELSISEGVVKKYLQRALRFFGIKRTREIFPIVDSVREVVGVTKETLHI